MPSVSAGVPGVREFDCRESRPGIENATLPGPEPMFPIHIHEPKNATLSRKTGLVSHQVVAGIVNHAFGIKPSQGIGAPTRASNALKRVRTSCRINAEAAAPSDSIRPLARQSQPFRLDKPGPGEGHRVAPITLDNGSDVSLRESQTLRRNRPTSANLKAPATWPTREVLRLERRSRDSEP